MRVCVRDGSRLGVGWRISAEWGRLADRRRSHTLEEVRNCSDSFQTALRGTSAHRLTLTSLTHSWWATHPHCQSRTTGAGLRSLFLAVLSRTTGAGLRSLFLAVLSRTIGAELRSLFTVLIVTSWTSRLRSKFPTVLSLTTSAGLG